MQFTQAEVEFLSGGFSRNELAVETRSEGWAPLPAGMPEDKVQRVIEWRSRKLGKKFVEFRASCARVHNEIVDSLERRIAASRLF
jgi:hypothetical protein